MFGNLPVLISAKLTDAAVHYRITARYLQSKICHFSFTFLFTGINTLRSKPILHPFHAV